MQNLGRQANSQDMREFRLKQTYYFPDGFKVSKGTIFRRDSDDVFTYRAMGITSPVYKNDPVLVHKDFVEKVSAMFEEIFKCKTCKFKGTTEELERHKIEKRTTFPKIGDKFYYLDLKYGEVCSGTVVKHACGSCGDPDIYTVGEVQGLMKDGFVYQTEQEAKEALVKIKSMLKGGEK